MKKTTIIVTVGGKHTYASSRTRTELATKEFRVPMVAETAQGIKEYQTHLESLTPPGHRPDIQITYRIEESDEPETPNPTDGEQKS